MKPSNLSCTDLKIRRRVRREKATLLALESTPRSKLSACSALSSGSGICRNQWAVRDVPDNNDRKLTVCRRHPHGNKEFFLWLLREVEGVEGGLTWTAELPNNLMKIKIHVRFHLNRLLLSVKDDLCVFLVLFCFLGKPQFCQLSSSFEFVGLMASWYFHHWEESIET